MEGNNVALLEQLPLHPRLTPFDVYPLFDSYPAATPDGRHWGAIGHVSDTRPDMGAVEFALLDAMWYAWLGDGSGRPPARRLRSVR